MNKTDIIKKIKFQVNTILSHKQIRLTDLLNSWNEFNQNYIQKEQFLFKLNQDLNMRLH